MLALRTPVLSHLVAGAIVTLAIALQPQPATHHRFAPIGRCVDDKPTHVQVPLDGQACGTLAANALNGTTRFAAVARGLPAECRDARQLVRQLDDAWLRGMDRGGEPADRLSALRTARELDLVFGGSHAEAIDDAMRTVIARATVEYIAEHDRGAAETAVQTAHLLGVDDPVVRAGEHWLVSH